MEQILLEQESLDIPVTNPSWCTDKKENIVELKVSVQLEYHPANQGENLRFY